jgi:hypothetical protein
MPCIDFGELNEIRLNSLLILSISYFKEIILFNYDKYSGVKTRSRLAVSCLWG